MKGSSLTGKERYILHVIILSKKKIIQRSFDALRQSTKKLARVMKGLSLTGKNILLHVIILCKK